VLKLGLKRILPNLLNSWEIGQGKVFGRINGAINFGLILMTWIAVQGFDLPFWFLFILIGLMGFLFLISGYCYEKLGFYRVEINRYNSINPFQKEVLERLEKIEKRLSEIG
jgi:Na+-transporting NADH:ubiquinone oxidoreductase subunit NqrB